MTAANLAKVPSSQLASPPEASVVEMVLTGGDLSKLTSAQRVSYLNALCESLGLNPLTRPFELLQLNGKWVVYARRDCTDQLRKIHKVSVRVVSRENVNDLLVVTTQATTPDGRVDESIGAVSIAGLRGENLANAMMKADTKAKRRVTLSICGLGFVDESEVESIPGAKVVPFSQELPRIDPHDDGGAQDLVDEDVYLSLLDRANELEAFCRSVDCYDKLQALTRMVGRNVIVDGKSLWEHGPFTGDFQKARDGGLLSPAHIKELNKIFKRVTYEMNKPKGLIASYPPPDEDGGSLSEHLDPGDDLDRGAQ